MNNPATLADLQHAARAFYRWFQGEEPAEESLLAVQGMLGSPLSLEEMRSFGARLRDNPEFLQDNALLIERWRARMEQSQPLSENEALAMIQSFFDSFDHAMLFDQELTANSTYIRRGEPSDSQLHFSGSMPCWTLHLTVRGSALIIAGDIEHSVRRGELMLFSPDARYHYGLHPREQHWEHLWALFQPRTHWQDLLQWRELAHGIFYTALPDNVTTERVETLFREVIQLGDEASPYRNDLRYNRLEELLLRARPVATASDAPVLDRRVLSACDYMQGRLGERFRLREVARHCSLSESRFAHLFREQMGMAPAHWINNQRLQRARKLLLETDDSIATVGQRVGFDDASHFSRYFNKSVGCSPREFRRSFSRGQAS